jgi:hypothetical protein
MISRGQLRRRRGRPPKVKNPASSSSPQITALPVTPLHPSFETSKQGHSASSSRGEVRPNRDYLLPAEALSDPNWGCQALVHGHLRSPNKTSTIPPCSEEEDWLLHGDVDIAIGAGNDHIWDSQQHDSNATEDDYFSTADDDSDGYGWEEDADEQSFWPPEVLHAPSNSHKRRCKRKAPNWPALNDLTYVPLVDADDDDRHQLQQKGQQLRDSNAGCTKDSEGGNNHGGKRRGDEGASYREHVSGVAQECQEGAEGGHGVQVGPGWGALALEPDLNQRVEADAQVPLGCGTSADVASLCPGGLPRTRRSLRNTAGSTAEEGAGPECFFETEEFFFDNPELLFSESENEEEGEEEFQVDEGGVRIRGAGDPYSIKYLFRDETWSQCTNEYAPGTLPFTGDPPGVRKLYRRMPSFLHLFGLFWTRAVLRNICIETNRYAKVVEEGKMKGGEDWYDMDKKELRTVMAVSLYMAI